MHDCSSAMRDGYLAAMPSDSCPGQIEELRNARTAANSRSGASVPPPSSQMQTAKFESPEQVDDESAERGDHRRVQLDAPITRALDLTGAVILLIVLLPVLLIVTLVVVVTDPGPVFFAHRRVGRDGRTFPCLKFRSMYVGAEEKLAAILQADPALRAQWIKNHKLESDPRITPIGAFLRLTSLDELPQLINVIRGDMSLVGPRPIVAAEVPRYGRFIASYYSVRPGLTGLWQVSGRSLTTYRRRVAMDVIYVRSKSLFLDIKLIVATVPAVLAGRGSQ